MKKLILTAAVAGLISGCAFKANVEAVDDPVTGHLTQLSDFKGAEKYRFRQGGKFLYLHPAAVLNESHFASVNKITEGDGNRKTSIILNDVGKKKLRAMVRDSEPVRVAFVKKGRILKVVTFKDREAIPVVIEID